MIAADLSILFGALFTVLVATALGTLLLRGLGLSFFRAEERVLAFVTGSALLSLLVFALAAARLAYPGVFAALGAAAIAAAVWRCCHRRLGDPLPAMPRFWKILFAVVFAVFTVLYFFTAMAPETSPDGAAYHLGLVSRYLRAHGFYRITTNMYANLSQGAELLFLFAFAFGRHSAAALVHYAFLVALPFSMLFYARRFRFPVAGAAGALFVYASPIVGFDGSSAYIDVAVACVLFAMYYLLQVWDQERAPALLVPIGLLAGFAYAVKYTAFLALPYALAFVGWRLLRKRQSLVRPLAVISVCALLLIVPWMAKNWIWLDNPVSPFFNKAFPNPYVHIFFEQQYRHQLANWNGVTNKADIPLEATVRGGRLQGVLGPVFLLAPLALLALRYRAGRHLLLAALVFGLSYPANIGTRFLIPTLPFLSLALAMVVQNWRGAAAALVIFHGLTSWPTLLRTYCDQYALRLDKIPVKAALRIQPESEYLDSRLHGYAVDRMLEQKVPPDAYILTFSAPPEAYTSRNLLVGYEGAFNNNMADLLLEVRNLEWQPARRFSFRFPAQAVRRIRLVQTSSDRAQNWSVNELRLYKGKQEVPREGQWRLRAHPNPWEVQMAFDNNPMTRWRSWEAMFAGMYLQVDFGRDVTIDLVTVDATPDQPAARLQLEREDANGRWRTLGGAPSQSVIPSPVELRKLISLELKWQGIEYLLINNNDFVAEDLRRNTKLWHVTVVAEAHGSRLYRID